MHMNEPIKTLYAYKWANQKTLCKWISQSKYFMQMNEPIKTLYAYEWATQNTLCKWMSQLKHFLPMIDSSADEWEAEEAAV